MSDVPGHDVVWLGPDRGSRCQCGWTAPIRLDFTRAHSKHAREARAHDEQQHRDWYGRTGHCGQCGSPGTYCLCISPCGCAGLHTVGSGLQPGALDGFSAAAPVDQGELFG